MEHQSEVEYYIAAGLSMFIYQDDLATCCFNFLRKGAYGGCYTVLATNAQETCPYLHLNSGC